MTDGKLCTMNLNHLMNTISIYVNSDCVECRRYSKHEHYKKDKNNKDRYKECYTEFIQRNANYKKKKKKKKLKKKPLIHTVS